MFSGRVSNAAKKKVLRKRSYILLLLLPLLAYSGLFAQFEELVSPISGWYSYSSQRNIIEITSLKNKVYAISEGGMFSYDLLSKEHESFSTINGLSNIDPTTVLADEGTDRVFIGFSDGKINYLDNEGQMHFISDISRNTQFTSKIIHHFRVHNGDLYIATDFGLVVYNILNKETRYSVTKVADNATGSSINDIAIAQGKIWIAMGALGVWAADLNVANPSLPSIWTKQNQLNGLPNGTSKFICSRGETLFAQLNDTIFEKQPNQNWIPANFPIGSYRSFNAANGNVFGAYGNSFCQVLWPDGNTLQLDNEGTIKCAFATEYFAFIGDKFAGLQRFEPGNGFFSSGLPGPRNNLVEDLDAKDGGLYIAPAGRSGSSAQAYDKSGIPYFNLNQEGWKITDHRGNGLYTDSVYQDFYRIAIDPITGHAFAGSWGEGIVELFEGKAIRTYTAANSGLPASSRGHLVSGICFDVDGNMWVSQYDNPHPLCMRDQEGQWYTFSSPYPMYASGVAVDDYGNKWITNNGLGIIIFNDNQTPADRSDDRWMPFTTTFGNGNLPNSSVHAVVTDHDQQVWIGTSEGVTIVYDPSLIWTNDFQDASCPIIDGYCLLRDQVVLDIVVDGDNRKWIASENGVYLVNVDGTELLKHFTTSNSPLFDNTVKALTIDQSTGEVFFGTRKGTLSYMGDAIAGLEDAEQLFAYPNPAFVDQESPIVIKGMRNFSGVKVVTASGKLVRQINSVGGEVTWDLHDQFGQRVTPGIYLIMVSDPDGAGAGITKIALIERKN